VALAQGRDIPPDVGIIQPVRGKRDPKLGPDALMVFIPSELQYLVRLTEAESLQKNDTCLYRLYRTTAGSPYPVTLSGPFLGAPHAVIGMEKLIVAGAKRIWVLGWCGALQVDLKIGQILIPTRAVSEEGTSSHYPVSDQPIASTASLNRMLEKALIQMELPFSKGTVWTTDALYRETPKKVEAYQKSGVLAVEMEMSALMTVAIFRSIEMAGLLVVSDQLCDHIWRPGFSNSLLRKHSRAAGEILLRLAGSFRRS
jgi:uridine phosphorylase